MIINNLNIIIIIIVKMILYHTCVGQFLGGLNRKFWAETAYFSHIWWKGGGSRQNSPLGEVGVCWSLGRRCKPLSPPPTHMYVW